MSIEEELEEIAKKADGILYPAAVVEYARNPETALHGEFTWNDTIAAEQWRIQQARQIIRVRIVSQANNPVTIRAYVSLSEDRQNPGGGYRRFQDVMADPELRRQYLRQALKEVEHWRQKFKSLEELDPVFSAIAEVEEQVEYAEANNLLPAKVLAVMSN